MPWEIKKRDGEYCVYKKDAQEPMKCYADKSKAAAYLAALYANAGENMSTTDGMWVEIFAVGKWNGMLFTLKDLEDIAAAFNTIGDNLRVPLKFGHNNDQPMTDGQPALGWVDTVKVENDKLMAHCVDVPEIVRKAVEKKLYRNVSVELSFGVEYKGGHYPLVLTAVALLGADIPAVNTLKDLTHYMSRGEDVFHAGRSAVFTAVAGKSKEISTMEKEELEKQQRLLAEQQAAFARKEAEFEAKQKAEAEAKQKAAISAARAGIVATLEEGVTSKKITPAQRERFSKMLRVDDDAAVLTIKVDDVKAFIAETAGATEGKFMANGAQGSAAGASEEDNLSADKIVLSRAQKLILEGKVKTLHAAQRIVFGADPDLAKRYANMNVKKEV